MLFMKDKHKKIGQRKSRAQSLVEFAITLPVLLLLFSGLVEFGFALNYYLSLLDATRETARYWSNFDPFLPNGSDNMDFYAQAAAMARANLDPQVANTSYQGRRIILDSATDDVVITVFGYSASTGVIRYPSSATAPDRSYHLFNNSTSMFTNAKIASQFASGSPNAGLLLVEVHYNYHQVMALPWLRPFVPNPLLLRAYTIMPISAAEPVTP